MNRPLGPLDPECRVDAVIKIGGSLLRNPELFARATRVLGQLRAMRIILVPGGGPLADAVRLLDERLNAGHEASHWMAILAMDQHAHLLAARIEASSLVSDAVEIARAIALGRLPILMPYRWIREEDPLPHSWEVTSDSIAAWLCARTGARKLILVKPLAGPVQELVDAHAFAVLPQGCDAVVVPSTRVEELTSVLPGIPERGRTWLRHHG